MAVVAQPPSQPNLWDSVVEFTKSGQEKNVDPLVWAVQLRSSLSSAGVSLPSIELADLLVSHICWDNHVPAPWKFIEKAMAVRIVPPMLVLALLSKRVIPSRRLHPAAYRLYMELLKRHAFSFSVQITGPNYQKVMDSIDVVLNLSHIFGLQVREPGALLVEFVFAVVWQLLDASLDDEGLLELSLEKKSRWLTGPNDMGSGCPNSFAKKMENYEGLHKANTVMAVEIIGDFLRNKVTSRILFLARQNMPSHWGEFVQQLMVLGAKSMALRNSEHISLEVLMELTSDSHKVIYRESKTLSKRELHAVFASGAKMSLIDQWHGKSPSSIWLPIDLFLEDAMDGSQVAAASAVEQLTGLVKALQALNGSTWHEIFLGLWIAALRLVQRERDPKEGPVPRVDTCLCMLLSITPLAIANIIEEEESQWVDESEGSQTDQQNETHGWGKCREGLITSLQQLGNYESLVNPPQCVQSVANQAAVKAIMHISGLSNGNGGYNECVSMNNDMPISSSGNMRHLIVEACIARKLVDTSSYLWSGYVCVQRNQVPHGVTGHVTAWSTLMQGSPLTSTLTSALIATPATSLEEIERIYEVAVNGSDDEKIAAASILCGASLIRGWSIQEHVILFIIRLLLPPTSSDQSEADTHLVKNARFLNVLLVGISPVDCVQIFSLHGLIPVLAGALMPICEIFGSCVPNTTWTLPTGEEFSSHGLFSIAFTLLLRLWRFDHPPLDYAIGDVPRVGPQPCPEYLLLVRNSQLACFGNSPADRMKLKRFSKLLTLPRDPIFMDTYPKLKRWYRQHQQCIVSTLSGLENESETVRQIVDSLLNMMFRKTNSKGSQSMTPSTSGSNSSGSGADEITFKLKVPAWDILEATPFVLDAAFTACGHGRIYPRELTTGLKDLADFLPATLATIVSYFSAEITRGVWKPAPMNGTDWPSPAANLEYVEQQIKQIIAATGVDIPSLTEGDNSLAMLPLPLAALVSLTITYKLDKASERFLVLIGPAVNCLAAACRWPCMPVVVSLWAQKVKRWSDFLVFSASRTVFHHNSDAVVQLLKSCFTSTLDLDNSHFCSNGGVGALLGHGFGSHRSGGISPVGPGILYLRVHRSVRDIMFMTEEILSLLMLSVKKIANGGIPRETVEKLKKAKYGARYRQASLTSAMARVKLAASLGASLVWISGGLNLVQTLIKETLPSWFLSVHGSESEGESGMVGMLGGYAIAYFAVLCGAFAWGVDSASAASKRRPKVLGAHMEFIASALEGKISLGCDCATWHAYVSGFVCLMVECAPAWVLEVDVGVLKRLSKGLRQWNEEELALALLGVGGVGAMASAAELIVQTTVQSSQRF